MEGGDGVFVISVLAVAFPAAKTRLSMCGHGGNTSTCDLIQGTALTEPEVQTTPLKSLHHVLLAKFA